MIWLALLMMICGLLLSAMFSGSETGFYRVTRVRLVIDALGGDRVAGALLWHSNRPSLFVASVLVGNNLANYMASAAIVLFSQAMYGSDSYAAQLVLPMLFSPVMFVYGELMPKNLFHAAPYRLLRRSGPFLLVCTVLFLPLSILLWAISKLLESISGQSPQKVQLTLARKEIQQLLEEGHEAGILLPTQRALAQGLFITANVPLMNYATPLKHLPRVRDDLPKSEVLRLLRRHRTPELAVESSQPPREVIGYYRAVELQLDASDQLPAVRPFIDLSTRDSHLAALIRLHNAGESIGRVLNEEGKPVALVTTRQLVEPLLDSQQ